jgi:hypothetical protein
MAEITIRLIYNTRTGKKDLFIDFESEPDALPIEHEQQHRAIVGQLLGKNVLREDELGEVVVRRVAPGVAAAPISGQESAPEAQPQTQPG